MLALETMSARSTEEVFERVDSFIDTGDVNLGIAFLDRAFDEFDAANDPVLHVRFDLAKAKLYSTGSRFDEVSEVLDDAARIIKEYPDVTDWTPFEAESYVLLGNASFRQGDYPRALDFIERSLERSEGKGLISAKAYIEKGGALAESSRRYEALEAYATALLLLKDDPDHRQLIRVYNNIADIHNKNGEWSEALHNAMKCLYLSMEHSYSKAIGFSHINASWALSQLGCVDDAITHYQQATEVLEDYEDPYAQGVICTLKGVLETSRENYTEAEVSFEQAKELLEEAGVRYYIARNYFWFSRLQFVQGNKAWAEELLNKALEIYDADGCEKEARLAREVLEDMSD